MLRRKSTKKAKAVQSYILHTLEEHLDKRDKKALHRVLSAPITIVSPSLDHDNQPITIEPIADFLHNIINRSLSQNESRLKFVSPDDFSAVPDLIVSAVAKSEFTSPRYHTTEKNLVFSVYPIMIVEGSNGYPELIFNLPSLTQFDSDIQKNVLSSCAEQHRTKGNVVSIVLLQLTNPEHIKSYESFPGLYERQMATLQKMIISPQHTTPDMAIAIRGITHIFSCARDPMGGDYSISDIHDRAEILPLIKQAFVQTVSREPVHRSDATEIHPALRERLSVSLGELRFSERSGPMAIPDAMAYPKRQGVHNLGPRDPYGHDMSGSFPPTLRGTSYYAPGYHHPAHFQPMQAPTSWPQHHRTTQEEHPPQYAGHPFTSPVAHPGMNGAQIRDEDVRSSRDYTAHHDLRHKQVPSMVQTATAPYRQDPPNPELPIDGLPVVGRLA